MISMRASGGVLEIDRIAGNGSFDEQVELAGKLQFARVKGDAEVPPAIGQSVLTKSAALLQRFDSGLSVFAFLHFEGWFSVKAHDVLIKGDARTIRELLEI